MKIVAALVADEFEDRELEVPAQRVLAVGHRLLLVGARRGQVLSGVRGEYRCTVDVGLDDAGAAAIDALLIPGGPAIDTLRHDRRALRLVREAFEASRPLGAICQGTELLIAAGCADACALTSPPGLRRAHEQAGARWRDEPVVRDGMVVTSRGRADVVPFCEEFLGLLEATPELACLEAAEPVGSPWAPR